MLESAESTDDIIEHLFDHCPEPINFDEGLYDIDLSSIMTSM